MNDKSKIVGAVESEIDIDTRYMKIKARIPEGVIGLVRTLPALNKTIHERYDILMEIVQYGNDIALHGTKSKKYYNIETQEFDVNGIFGNWAKPNPNDNSRKIAREVCSIIKKQMFE